MFRIDDPSASASLPAILTAGTPGYFGRGDPGAGVRPTTLTVDWANMMQEELFALLTASGVVADKANRAQIRAALDILYRPGRLVAVTQLTGSGTFTPAVLPAVVPARSAQLFVVEMVGGGGGGGGAAATGAGEASGGGGGASGAYLRFSCDFAYLNGASYAVGAGGGGGSGTGGGTTGGNTTFGAATAPGGNGGAGGTISALASILTAQGTAGAVPTAAGANVLVASRGSLGMYGIVLTDASGPTSQQGGGGGDSHFGGGGQNTGSGNGNPGVGPGSGGSGGANAPSGISRDGGAGAAGTILVYQYS